MSPEPDCERCGGTGQVIRVVHEREGFVQCPDCGGGDGS